MIMSINVCACCTYFTGEDTEVNELAQCHRTGRTKKKEEIISKLTPSGFARFPFPPLATVLTLSSAGVLHSSPALKLPNPGKGLVLSKACLEMGIEPLC